MPSNRASVSTVPPASRASASTTEVLLARVAASGPPVEPFTRWPKRASRASGAPGSFVSTDIPAATTRIGSEAGPNQPRKTSTSRRVRCTRGSAKCSEAATLIARAGLPGKISNARPWRAARSSTRRPPCQAKPGESITPAALARVPPLIDPALAPGLK